jgi:hypothetical protein
MVRPDERSSMTANPGPAHGGASRAASPELRIGDRERDTVAAALSEHFALGRLTREEFDERLDGATRAKTAGDLRLLVADLPALATTSTPRPAESDVPATTDPGAGDLRGHLFVYLAVNITLWVVWASTGAGFPWPIFPTVFWGLSFLPSSSCAKD